MIIFGDGLHAINIIKENGSSSYSNILNVEENVGHGYIGKVKPEHYYERTVDFDELNSSEGNTLWKFKNPESVRAVINSLLEIESSLKAFAEEQLKLTEEEK